MNEFCQQAGCNQRQQILHAWKWAKKRWHAHPSMTFTGWWQPFEFDPVSGAHVGGHPDAYRRWSRKDGGGWKHRWYGISTVDAWNVAQYVEEFNAWQEIGSPEKAEEFISISATKERQIQYWKDAKPLMNLMLQGAKPTQTQPLVEELNRKYPGYEPINE